MALKVTAGYIPADDCVLNFNQTTKERENHSLLFTGLLIRNKGSLILTVRTMLFYFTHIIQFL